MTVTELTAEFHALKGQMGKSKGRYDARGVGHGKPHGGDGGPGNSGKSHGNDGGKGHDDDHGKGGDKGKGESKGNKGKGHGH